MKRNQMKLTAIIFIVVSVGMLLVFSGCTNKIEPIDVEIVILHPITGKELSTNTGFIYTTTEIRHETPFVAKYKNKATGEYLTDEELKPVKYSIGISLSGYDRDGISFGIDDKEYWPREPGTYYYFISFDSLDQNKIYYDKFNQTRKKFDFTVKKGEEYETKQA